MSLKSGPEFHQAQMYVVVLPCCRHDGEMWLGFERGDGELQLPAVRQTEDQSVDICIAKLSGMLATPFDIVPLLLNLTYGVERAGEAALRIVVRLHLALCPRRPEPDPERCDLVWLGLDAIGTAPIRDIYAAPVAAAVEQLRTQLSPV